MGRGLDRDQGLSPGARVDCTWPESSRRPAVRRRWRRLSDLPLPPAPACGSALLLAAPVGWLVIAYLGLAGGPASSPRSGSSTPSRGEIVARADGLQNFQDARRDAGLPDDRAPDGRRWPRLVTVTDALLAFPIAYYMARIASPRTRRLLVVAVLMPLWASYLVKVYAWRIILARSGVAGLGCSSRSASTARATRRRGTWLVFTYLWLPYMILPIYAGLERIPDSLLEASADLGGAGRHDLPPRGPAARLPGARGRLDLHVLAHARRLHHARRSSRARSSSATSSTTTSASRTTCRSPPRIASVPIVDHDRLPPGRAAAGRVRVAVSASIRATCDPDRCCGSATALVLAFIYLPLVVIAHLRVQRRARSQAWPIDRLHARSGSSEAFAQPGRARRVL